MGGRVQYTNTNKAPHHDTMVSRHLCPCLVCLFPPQSHSVLPPDLASDICFVSSWCRQIRTQQYAFRGIGRTQQYAFYVSDVAVVVSSHSYICISFFLSSFCYDGMVVVWIIIIDDGHNNTTHKNQSSLLLPLSCLTLTFVFLSFLFLAATSWYVQR